MVDPHIRHRALRAIAEGTDTSLERLAEATGRSLRGLQAQAQREGWVIVAGEPQDVARRVRRAAAMLLGRLEALGRGVREGEEGLSRAEIDGITAMIRGLDKIGEIMRSDEAANDNKNGSDEDVAAVLQAINDRIVALARELAACLVAGSGGGEGRLAGQERMDP